jgi:hypothetical protein
MLTNEHRSNLTKLATHLEGLRDDYEQFTMASFAVAPVYTDHLTQEWRDLMREYALRNGGVPCNTSACAVGHGPAAGVLIPEQFLNTDPVTIAEEGPIDWLGYSKTVFVPDYDERTTDGLDDPRQLLWSWMFSGGWAHCDNKPRGAAARIRYVLEHGAPPEGYCSPDWLWKSKYEQYLVAPTHVVPT